VSASGKRDVQIRIVCAETLLKKASTAVPVGAWIGRIIMAVDETLKALAEVGKGCLQVPWKLAKILAKKGLGG